MPYDIKAVEALKERVSGRERLIRGFLEGAGIESQLETLLALMAIVHIDLTFAALQKDEMGDIVKMAEEIYEAKKKGVM